MEIMTLTSATEVAPTLNDPNAAYREVTEAEVDALRKKHAWIAEPLITASDLVAQMPFYQWLRGIESPLDFAPVAKQLYFHSATFPKVLGLMLGFTPLSENIMMPFYSKHAFGEADHCELLVEWMLKHGILSHRDELNEVIVTPETNACVNMGYQLAIERDRANWVIAMNCGIERCSNDFFGVASRKMHDIGSGDIYFDIHVEADEFHSIMGMEHLDVMDPNSVAGKKLIAKGLESVSAWAAMIHSWIGIDYHPKFNMDGSLKSACMTLPATKVDDITTD